MSFFVDRHNRRKTTIALTAFCLGFGFLCLFAVLALLLAEPLYRLICFRSEVLTTIIHSAIVALLGTAVCCLTFLLKDKRIAPYSFAGLAVWLCMFYAAAFLLEAEARGFMFRMISMFGLAPVLVGNAVAWPVYFRMKRANPALNHRKTLREELKEAVERDASGQLKGTVEEPAGEAAMTKQTGPLPEEALFSPETEAAYRRPCRSEGEEAMLLYEGPEESYD